MDRALLMMAIVLAGCGGDTPSKTPSIEEDAPMTLAVTSSAFAANGAIPTLHTCEGDDVSPPLSWQGAPDATASYALILDDPDAPDPAAPQRTWVHWVLYDIPADARELAEGGPPPKGTRAGTNDFKKTAYGGPCPPIGTHRYFHKLYALDVKLGDLHEPTKAKLLEAMEGHVLAWGELIGTYKKQAK
jgi:Raf kinase inhibitor-like YbhB/YbcL family protein